MFGDTAFVCAGSTPLDTKVLNTQRFLYPTVKNEKAKLKATERICKELAALICGELGGIGALHDELEEFYKSAMNYERLDRFTKKLLIKMFC